MALWSCLKGLGGLLIASSRRLLRLPQAHDPFAAVHWVRASSNPWRVDVLDCTPVAQSMLSWTQDQQIAERFVTLRASNGEQYRGCLPENTATKTCDLNYPPIGDNGDGPLFKAATMEDKWDIYRHGSCLYFARSWTGELIYHAQLADDAIGIRLVAISARRQDVDEGSRYLIAVVDFLIRSHIYLLPMPHPLPQSLGRDARELALHSFTMYGRHGLYGTFADTVGLQG